MFRRDDNGSFQWCAAAATRLAIDVFLYAVPGAPGRRPAAGKRFSGSNISDFCPSVPRPPLLLSAHPGGVSGSRSSRKTYSAVSSGAPGPSIPSFPADHRAAPRPPEPATPTDPHTTVAEAAKPHQYRSNSQKAPGSRASGVGISTHRDQPGTPCPRLRLTDLSASRSRAASSTALVPIFREIAAWRLRHPHRRNSVATSCAGGPFRAAAREARFGRRHGRLTSGPGTGGSLQAPAREAHFRPRHGRNFVLLVALGGMGAVFASGGPPAGALRLRGRVQDLAAALPIPVGGWVSCGLPAPFAIDPGQAEQIIGRAASFDLSHGGSAVLTFGRALSAGRLWVRGWCRFESCVTSPAPVGVVVGFRLASRGLPPVRWWRPCR